VYRGRVGSAGRATRAVSFVEDARAATATSPPPVGSEGRLRVRYAASCSATVCFSEPDDGVLLLKMMMPLLLLLQECARSAPVL